MMKFQYLNHTSPALEQEEEGEEEALLSAYFPNSMADRQPCLALINILNLSPLLPNLIKPIHPNNGLCTYMFGSACKHSFRGLPGMKIKLKLQAEK